MMNRADLLESIYYRLKEMSLTSSMDDFSMNWIGKEKSYLRVLRAKKKVPSMGALVNCSLKLRTVGRQLLSENDDRGDKLLHLFDRCIKEIYGHECALIDVVNPAYAN